MIVKGMKNSIYEMDCNLNVPDHSKDVFGETPNPAREVRAFPKDYAGFFKRR
jgi:hypothetical protein